MLSIKDIVLVVHDNIGETKRNAEVRWNEHNNLPKSGNLIWTNKRTMEDWFCLEMVSHRAINNIIQGP